MTVNTKQSERREIELRTLEDISAELDKIQAAHDAGALSATGNWAPGQILEHVAKLMECAMDGFPGGAPAPVRWIITLLFKKKALRGGAPPAGFKIPKGADFLAPGEDTSFEQGMSRLRAIIARAQNGERFTHDSPIFGKLTHEQWITLNAGHATLHLSFLRLDTPPGETP